MDGFVVKLAVLMMPVLLQCHFTLLLQQLLLLVLLLMMMMVVMMSQMTYKLNHFAAVTA